MSITEPYTAAAGQARTAVEKSVEVWKHGAQTLTEQTSIFTQLPNLDLAQGVEGYFQFVQQVVDSQREVAFAWASAAASLSSVVREQAESVGQIVRDQTEALSGFATEQVDKAEDAAKEQARLARQAKRQLDRQAHELARAPYVGLTKAELSDLLAERELPKTGNVDELIERLVEADTK